ncbi:MAG: hypothetical protein IPH03_17270 [Tetrasphaera sp.]|nr:hypothetical protein [Tetrasphaera sp.]
MNATRGTEKWECDFVLALRVRDVPGEAIGAALAEVQAHCADTGQTPAEVFGPPLAYAVSLALPENAPRRARTLGTTALTLLGVLGLWVLPPAAGAWLRGESYAVSHGSLVGAAVLAVVVAVVAAPMALGWLSRRPGLAFAGLVVGFLGAVLPSALWRSTAATMSPVWPAVVGALAVAGAAYGLIRTNAAALDDRLVDPVTRQAQAVPRWLDAMTRYYALGFPAVAILLTILAWRAPTR